MTARQLGILINHRGQPFLSLAIGAFPERTKSAGRTDDRQITYVIGSSDFTQLVRHARTTGNARDHSARPVKYAIQHALRAAHFPQHVDIDRALATGQFKGTTYLFHRTLTGILDHFLMPFASCSGMNTFKTVLPHKLLTITDDVKP